MDNGIFNEIAVKARVREYLYPKLPNDNPINAQIIRAFRALTFFLSGHGFRNENGSNASKRLRNMLVLSDQRVCLRNWDLSGADLSGADLSGSDLSRAVLKRADPHSYDYKDAWIYAYLSGAKYCKDPKRFTKLPDDFDPKEHGMIEIDLDGKPVE